MATIKQSENGDLAVSVNGGYEYRRVSGVWQMLGNSGEWFDCEIHDPIDRRMVADFECCLSSYSFADGPSYPTGRRRGEDVGKFIRRKQIEELRADAKNIFAPVHLKYDAHNENMKRFARQYRYSPATKTAKKLTAVTPTVELTPRKAVLTQFLPNPFDSLAA